MPPPPPPPSHRTVASLAVPGGQEFQFPHSFLIFRSIFLIFPQIFLTLVLILALRVGDSPTRKGVPKYVTVHSHSAAKIVILRELRLTSFNEKTL